MKTENTNELTNEVDRLREKAQAIIIECNKWVENPEAVFRHGYAKEKADGITAILKRNEKC